VEPRLLRYYNEELAHLREMGAEFARQFPKIAARLGVNGLEVSDPYVERLLEGVGFLAARVRLKLDAEFPRFTQRLLAIVYPHYLAPTPAMLIAQLAPDPGESNLAQGVTVPRGSPMRSVLGKGDTTPCEFRTAHDVTLWPLTLAAAEYFTFAPDLPLATMRYGARAKGGIRLRLKTTAGLAFKDLRLERLRIFLGGSDETAFKLHELCLGACIGGAAVPPGPRAPWHEPIAPGCVRSAGFADDEALLPPTLRTFAGYRLLQEYFAFPQRFLFVDIDGLAPAVRRVGGDELEIVLFFGRGMPELESVVDASNFALFCTPAANLFPRRADRIHVNERTSDFHVVVDRTRPNDFEIYDIASVTGYGVGSDSEQPFLPFYAAYHHEPAGHHAYYTVQREPRLVSEAQRKSGFRTSYIGSEVYLSIVDPDEAPFRTDLRQLAVGALCTNRDLPLQMPVGAGKTDLFLDIAAPVEAIRCLKGPSKPYSSLGEGPLAWRFISHLSLNYLSLLDNDERDGAAALREMLALYAATVEGSSKRQIEGLQGVRVRPAVRRLPMPGPICFGRGLEVVLDVDELQFQGASAFLFGSVLERFLARHVSINAFTETVLRSTARGEIMRWMPRCGTRATI
jgi:type VI secretion system protein ImpG